MKRGGRKAGGVTKAQAKVRVGGGWEKNLTCCSSLSSMPIATVLITFELN
jgi:hypothetical protein